MNIKEKLNLVQNNVIVSVYARGDHWQEEIMSEVNVDINQDWTDFINDIMSRGVRVACDYFDPADEGIYQENYENCIEYFEAIDEAFSNFCFFDVRIKIGDCFYNIEGELL